MRLLSRGNGASLDGSPTATAVELAEIWAMCRMADSRVGVEGPENGGRTNERRNRGIFSRLRARGPFTVLPELHAKSHRHAAAIEVR